MRVDDLTETRARAPELSPANGGRARDKVPYVSRKPHRRRAVAVLVALAVLIALAGGGVFADLVRNQATSLETTLLNDLQQGQAELEAGKASLTKANATHDHSLIDQAKLHFVRAETHFQAAGGLADHSRLLRQLEGLPSVGAGIRARHAAVDAVSAMGVQLSLAGQHLSDLDGDLIAPPASGQQGRSLLTMVDQVQAQIGPVTDELKSALTASDQVDLTILPASQRQSFLRAQGSINKALSAISQFQALVPIMTEVLGGNGARTYLIEQVNPAELRPGGGFIGTYSVLRADHGSLSLLKSGNASDFIVDRTSRGLPGYVQPPAPFEEFIPGTSWSFIDSNFFADFPTNALTGANFASAPLATHIDAVFAFDYYTVAALLSVTGPIGVPGYPLTLSADNFVSTVVQYDLQSITNPAAGSTHKAILSAVAGPLLQKIVALQPSQWPALIGALNGLAASRDLQVYFNNSAVEKTMTQYGWSGVLNTTKNTDYMMEVEANLGGTKANYFVTRHYTVELTRIGPVIHHKVTIDVTDNMPYSFSPHDFYHAYVRMLTAGNADSMSDDLGHPQHLTDAPTGTMQLDGWLLIHGSGRNQTVMTFNWNTPWSPNGRGVEQIYWQKQPGTLADKVDVIWNDGHGDTYKVSGDLAQDRVITLSTSGVLLSQGQVGTAQLPSLSLG